MVEVTRDNEYILLLKTEYANDSNRWYIGGFVDECTEECICCAGDTYDYISDVFQLTNEMTDMYIAFYMSEIINNEINYMQRGLYTCNMEIPDKFTRVRAELRINREGLFTSADNNVLVYNEEGFDITKYTYEDLKPLLLNKNIQPQQRSIVMVLFQHNNENTISMCKKFYKSDKNNFEQACVYNPVKVQMDFYKPVPQFYKLYDIFCENIYFDLGFIDDLRE